MFSVCSCAEIICIYCHAKIVCMTEINSAEDQQAGPRCWLRQVCSSTSARRRSRNDHKWTKNQIMEGTVHAISVNHFSVCGNFFKLSSLAGCAVCYNDHSRYSRKYVGSTEMHKEVSSSLMIDQMPFHVLVISKGPPAELKVLLCLLWRVPAWFCMSVPGDLRYASGEMFFAHLDHQSGQGNQGVSQLILLCFHTQMLSAPSK